MAQPEPNEYLLASRRLRAKLIYEEGVLASDVSIFPLSIRRVDATIALQHLTSALLDDLQIGSKGCLLRLEFKRSLSHANAGSDAHNGPTMFVATKLLRGNLFRSIRGRSPANGSAETKIMAREIILSREGLLTPLFLGDVNMTSAYGDYIVQAYCAIGNSLETKQARRVPIPAGVCFPTEGLLRVLGRGTVHEAEAGDLCRDFCLYGKCCPQGDRCTFLHVAPGAVKAFFGALSCEKYPRLPNLSDMEFRSHIDAKCPYFHRTNKQSTPLSPWLSLAVPAPDAKVHIRHAPAGDARSFAYTIGAVMGLCFSYYATHCESSKTDQKGCDIFCCHLHQLEGKYGATTKQLTNNSGDSSSSDPPSESPLPPPPPAAAPTQEDFSRSMQQVAASALQQLEKRSGPPPPYGAPIAIDGGALYPKQPRVQDAKKKSNKNVPRPLSESLHADHSDRSALGISPVGEDQSLPPPPAAAAATVASTSQKKLPVQQSSGWGDYDVFNAVPLSAVPGSVTPTVLPVAAAVVHAVPPQQELKALDDDGDDDSWLNSLQDRFQQQASKLQGAAPAPEVTAPLTATQPAATTSPLSHVAPTTMQPSGGAVIPASRVASPAEPPAVKSPLKKAPPPQQLAAVAPRMPTVTLTDGIELIGPIEADDEIDDGETIPAEIADGIRYCLQRLGPTGRVLQKRYPLLLTELTHRYCSLQINNNTGSRVFLVAAQRVQKMEKVSRSFLGFREDLQIPVVVEVYEDDVCQQLTRRLKTLAYQKPVVFLPELKEIAINSVCHPGLLGYVCHELQSTRDSVTRKSFHRISVVSELYICTLRGLVEAWDTQHLPVALRLRFLRFIMKELLDIVHDLHTASNMHGAVMHHGLINWDTVVFDTKGKVRLLDPTLVLAIDPNRSPSIPAATSTNGAMTRETFDLKCCAAIAVIVLVGASNSVWYETFCHSGVFPPVSPLTPNVPPGIDKYFAVAFDDFICVLAQQGTNGSSHLLRLARCHPFLWSLDESMEFLGTVGYALEHSALLEMLRKKYVGVVVNQPDETWTNRFLLVPGLQEFERARLAVSTLRYSCSTLGLLKIIDNHRPNSGNPVQLPADALFEMLPAFLMDVFKDVSQCLANIEEPQRDHGLGKLQKFLVNE